MNRIFVVRVVLLAIMAAAVAGVALQATATARAEAAACRCPLIYAPVVCDNGKTYPNQCVADCRNASGCVPSGI